MEDVDAAFNKRVQTSEDGYQSSVTFSGFLNALDGVASGEERIIFLTTNHLEKLDPALIRPGRVDMAELIDDAHPEQTRTLFERFYGGGSNDAQVLELAKEVEEIVRDEWEAGRRVSMAALQGHFIRNEAKTAVDTCRTLFK
jgi:mitochondrial chaperone BCS1